MAKAETLPSIEKALTGIEGLDEITKGGLPRGRPTLVCGGAGSGKTLMGMEFLVNGAALYGEPGVFIAFEESSEELVKNTLSLGFKVNRLISEKKLFLDYVKIERSEIEETGEYDLEGLFIRIKHAIDTVGAKRIVLDTMEMLFSGIPNLVIVRAEIRRLFQWLKDQNMTALVTAEQGTSSFSRHGLEEYVSDCVIFLDHRVRDQVSTRRIRIVKYRGSGHGTNEFPFLIDKTGIVVMPITSMGLRHLASTERVSTGIKRLDAMLDGKGYFKGSSVLISGTAGTGKTSIAATFSDAACSRGEKCIYFAFEESQDQVVRNMGSLGLDLGRWIKKGLLIFHAERPTMYDLETHLFAMVKMIQEIKPQAVVVDPVSNLVSVGGADDVKRTLIRLLDVVKVMGTTVIFTSLTAPVKSSLEATDVGISSLADTWLLLRDIEIGGEKNRAMYILKSRGMAHSNQIREFIFTDHGVELVDVYVGPGGVLTGTARLTQVAMERAEEEARQEDIEVKQLNLERKRKIMRTQIDALKTQYEAEEAELVKLIQQQKQRQKVMDDAKTEMRRIRKAD